MLSEVKKKQARKNFICSKFTNCMVLTAILAGCIFSMTCFGTDGTEALTTAKSLLSKAATAGGGLWAVWGLVQLGMSIKDNNGPGIGGAVWQIVGGAIKLLRTTPKYNKLKVF